MSMRKRWKKSLKDEIKIYDDFLGGVKKLVELAPGVEDRRKEAQAKLAFVEHMPDSIIEEVGPKLYGIQKQDEEAARQYVPDFQYITRETKRFLVSGTSTSSDYVNIIQTYINSAPFETSQEGVLHFQGPLEPIEVKMVYDTFTKLVDERAKSKTLPPRLNRINKNLGKKFRVAQQSYNKAKNGLIGVDQSGIQLRSVLEQLWGGLVILIRKINPLKYTKADLKLNATGKAIAIECLAASDTNKKKLTELLEIVSKIHDEISKPDFGKNPLSRDKQKLAEIYDLWLSVVNDIADYVYLNIRIKAARVTLK